MSDRTKVAAQAKNIVLVPLNKLKKSPKNVRKIPHGKADIKAFAASIAALGMLQFPLIEPELDAREKPTGFYLVNAGEGRRLAQLLRAKRKEIKRPTKLLIVQCRVFGDDPVAEPRCAAGSRSSNISIIFPRKRIPRKRIGDGGQQAAPAGRSDRGSLR